MDIRFAATGDNEVRWCSECFEKVEQVQGIAVDKWGVYAATRCTACGDIELGDNPFEEVNGKLDKLLAWAGLE